MANLALAFLIDQLHGAEFLTDFLSVVMESEKKEDGETEGVGGENWRWSCQGRAKPSPIDVFVMANWPELLLSKGFLAHLLSYMRSRLDTMTTSDIPSENTLFATDINNTVRPFMLQFHSTPAQSSLCTKFLAQS